MQTKNQLDEKATIGALLKKLSETTGNEKKTKIRDIVIEKIKKYPDEMEILMCFIEEASKGRKKISLKNGVLIPDFSKDGITSKISDGHVIASWNE